MAATLKASDGISNITVFSNTMTIGKSPNTAVLTAAVNESCHSSTSRNHW